MHPHPPVLTWGPGRSGRRAPELTLDLQRRELDASPVGGELCSRPASLTRQQLEIADLAAEGLTNKEIGKRLFLSHRTVSIHLYQLFPKLGITSRAALRDALKGTPRRNYRGPPRGKWH